MESQDNVMCPVCTLYLRSGITLSDHLSTHPKECVIEALVKMVKTRPHVSSQNFDGNNVSTTPAMYHHFVNNYGPMMNENYHNTVITANISNSTNYMIPVIMNTQPQQPLQEGGRPPVDTGHSQVSNYDTMLQNTHVQSNPSNYGAVPNFNDENNTFEIDPLVQQQEQISIRESRSDQNQSSANNHNSTNDSVGLNQSNYAETKTIENQNANSANDSKAEDQFDNQRKDVDDSCSQNCSRDFLDLDNQNQETNIGTVISGSHQVISPDEYSSIDIRTFFSTNNDGQSELATNSRYDEFRNENSGCEENNSQNLEFFSQHEDVNKLRMNQTLYLFRETDVDYNDNDNSSFVSSSHHTSMESLVSNSEDEEFIICNDAEALKQNRRRDEDEEENDQFRTEAETSSFDIKEDPTVTSSSNLNNDNDESEESTLLSPIINIETDEMMPPQGELSGQDSLSAADENSLWSNHVESSSPSYKIFFQIKRETASKESNEENGDEKLNKCPTCSMSFSSVEEHKLHVEICIAKKDIATEPGSSKDSKEQVCPTPDKKFPCLMCVEEFNALKELTEHLNTAHQLSVNQCSTCLETFQSSIEFKQHIRTVHPLECTVCGKYFNTRSGLVLHRKRHLTVKPYQCTICSKSFVTKQKLMEHMNVHLGKTPIKCNLCPNNVSFKSYSNVTQHRRNVHLKLDKKIRDYFCDCGEIFHSRKRLFWHSETHEKPKVCSFCPRKFVHLSSLTRHIRRIHDESFLPFERSKENVKCSICNLTFLRSSLVGHMETHSGKKPYSCDICNKNFTTKWNLSAHRWIHMSRKLKPYKCKLCNAAFIYLKDFQAHERSHTKTRPFSCNHCGKQFIHQYNCIRHVREHEEEKRFSCEICKKTFHRSYYLSEHLKIHSGLKPYSCHICGKASSTKSNHNKHVRTHHAREPVSSEV